YFYNSQSLPLASAIHYYVAGGAPSSNRGVRRRGFYVLRKTTVPSVLVECGFLTNATEANYAQSAAYRQKLAEEIGRGVRERSLVASTSAANRLAANNTAVPLRVTIETLMDQAGAGVACAVRQFFPKPARCIVFAGKGHNGGDALVAAEQLQRIGWKIDVRLPFAEEDCSELTQKKLKTLR